MLIKRRVSQHIPRNWETFDYFYFFENNEGSGMRKKTKKFNYSSARLETRHKSERCGTEKACTWVLPSQIEQVKHFLFELC